LLRKFKIPFEIVLISIVLIVHSYVVTAPANNMMAWFSTDDAFYYFKVAQNIAEGFGSTFDRINLTNGYHPLWTFMLVPIFALAKYDLVLPLRLTILLLAVVNAGTSIVLYRLLRRVSSKEIAMFMSLFWVLSPRIHGATVELGMESGINALFTAWLIYWVTKLEDFRSERKINRMSLIQASIVAGLAVFSRLDNAFLAGVMGLWILFRFWQSSEKISVQDSWKRRFEVAVCYFAPWGLSLLIYMLINLAVFGTFMPVSGQIKRWWGTLPNTVYGFPVDSFWVYLTHWVTPQENIGPWGLYTSIPHSLAYWVEGLLKLKGSEEVMKSTHRWLVLGFSAVGLGLILAVLRLKWSEFKQMAIKTGLPAFFVACAIQLTTYKATGYISMHNWYWVIELVWMAIAGAIFLECVFQILLRVIKNRWVWRMVLAAASLSMLWTFVYVITTLVPAKDEPGWEEAYMWGARGLEANTEPGSLIGTPGGGALGYFTKGRTIVNLDGLMNSYDYFKLLQKGQTRDFLDRIGLDYVYGAKYMLTESDPYWHAFKDNVMYIQKVEGTALFKYLPKSTKP
jgi:hypothetical protein